MLDSIPSRLLTEWMEFYKRDPFGEQRADIRMAMIVSKTHNVHCTKKSYMIKPAECMLFADAAPMSEPDEEKMKLVCQKMAAMFGGPTSTNPEK